MAKSSSYSYKYLKYVPHCNKLSLFYFKIIYLFFETFMPVTCTIDTNVASISHYAKILKAS